MKHFQHVPEDITEELFFVEPHPFTKHTQKNVLSYSLGATLYTPATKPDLLHVLQNIRKYDATSSVICLEDSIPDEKVEEAEKNLTVFLSMLDELDAANVDLPLLFVRPRTPEHLERLFIQNGHLLNHLTGFVFPKFDGLTYVGVAFTETLQRINTQINGNLYFMPVLETPSIIHRETREATLHNLAHLFAHNRDQLLAVRIGATDMSSSYGLRRNNDFTVYDVHVVSSAIADIVNFLGRDMDGHTITGAVWEHFRPSTRTFKPLLRETLFAEDKQLRTKLLTSGYDTFIREIQMDKINGITGKTVIYPSHIPIVHSLLVVSHEEYSDAQEVLKDTNSGGGAYASTYKNKMNEVKPHTAWAKKTLTRAETFGVAKPGTDFVDFLESLMI